MTIRFDDKGGGVVALQRALLSAGYELPRYGADGHLGAETWHALGVLAESLGVPMLSVDIARAHAAQVPSRLLEHLAALPRPSPLDELGTGVFVRLTRDWPIEDLARFDWACVAVINERRHKLNRDPAWWGEARAAGVTLIAMDWLPRPDSWGPGLAAAIAWAAEHGAVCYAHDCEGPAAPEGWNGAHEAARAYVLEARKRCVQARIGLGGTSLAIPAKSYPRVLIEGCADLSIPQPYDRDHQLDPAYAQRSIEAYRRLGAQRIALGRGAFRRYRRPDGKLKSRWRLPLEVTEHRATTPATGLVGTAWWPPAGRMPASVLDAIVS